MRPAPIFKTRRQIRSGQGSGLVEAVTAAFILIPIALFLIDVTVLVLANSMNDTAAKNAARAGANQPDLGSAVAAANKALASFKSSPFVKSLILKTLDYDGNEVSATTQMQVRMPVPFPGFSEFTFVAKDVEPVVGGD